LLNKSSISGFSGLNFILGQLVQSLTPFKRWITQGHPQVINEKSLARKPAEVIIEGERTFIESDL